MKTSSSVRGNFLDELDVRRERVDAYLTEPCHQARFRPEHLQRAALSYIMRGGKRLRPAVLLWACGAAGGDEDAALPAAAGVEVFHTWTLVHDDLIDNDSLRRGAATTHEEAACWARDEFGYNAEQARTYGRDVSILTGDILQGWSVCLFLETAQRGVDPALAGALTYRLESDVITKLIGGEALDVQFSRRAFDSLSESEIIEMLWLKTGVLYEFAGLAGACMGAGQMPEDCQVAAQIGAFCGQCGIAFQLQDDILGITGNESKLGKPVGSDIREGKRTTIALHAYQNATPAQRRILDNVLGNPKSSEAEVLRVRDMFIELGGVDRAQGRAESYLQKARKRLESVPESQYTRLLQAWADYMINRSF